jgi:uncharacterized protein
MSIYRQTIPRFTQVLVNLEAWLDAGVKYAEAKSFDPAVLLTARLAPDQYPLIRQIQAACDQAKAAPARLTAKEPPKHPDTEQTLAEIRARIATVKTYLATYDEKDFEGAAERVLVLPALRGKAMLGQDYLDQFALPNFYFHVSMAYAILRHNGVPLGKTDFIGAVDLR